MGHSATRITLAEAQNYGPILACPWDVSPSHILHLLRQAYRAGQPIGLDTEFSHDLQLSPAFRALPLLWSLGIPGHEVVGAKNRRVARRAVLHPSVMEDFRAWFESDHPKILHNASVDLHVLHNAGFTCAAVQDTLPLSRYLHPDRKDHSLKWHIEHTLGYRTVGEYRDLFFRYKLGKRGLPTKQREPIPLVDIIPDPSVRHQDHHSLWPTLLQYAALDAKATVELWQELRA